MVGLVVPALAYEEGGYEFFTTDWYAGGVPTKLLDNDILVSNWEEMYKDENDQDVYFLAGYLGYDETVKLPGKIDGITVMYLGGIHAMDKEGNTPENSPVRGVLRRDNTTTTKVIFPCTMKVVAGSNTLWDDVEDPDAEKLTYVFPPDLEFSHGQWVFGGGNSPAGFMNPKLNIIVEENSPVHEFLKGSTEGEGVNPEYRLNVIAVPADDPEMLAIHNWDEGSTNASGKTVYTCQDCGEVHEAEANQITAENMVAGYKAKAQKIKLNASALGDSVLTYKSSSSKVKVSESGTVTLPKKFSGKVTITITANDPSRIYGKATKKVTVTVPKAPTLKTAKSTKAKQLTVKWSKVKGATGYQLWYKTGSKTKTVKITKVSTVKKVLKKLKTGKTYKVKVRSYIKSGKTLYYSNWSKVKKVKIK